MKKIKYLIFDFDGTLVDTAPLIIRTMQETIKALSLPEKSEADCRATIGLRLEEIPAILWPDVENLSEKYAYTYRRIFNELKRPLNVECYPKVIDTLRVLHKKGYKMAIASSRSHKSLEEYVELFRLGECFSMLVGGDDVKNGKPPPDPVLAILDAQDWLANETITIGDAPVDILMGKAAGTMTCAVTYGNSTYEALAETEPDKIVGSFDKIMQLLNNQYASESFVDAMSAPNRSRT